MNRVGIGYDVHRLGKDRALTLGGITIEYHLGLEGHSDADVLIHALMDALLGAAGLRDIGYYFPPADPRFSGISSLELLKQVRQMLAGKGWRLFNADTVVIAEAPALMPYIGKMVTAIASALEVPAGRITVKATTTEGLGFCGRGEGIAAQAVVLLENTATPGPAGQEAE